MLLFVAWISPAQAVTNVGDSISADAKAASSWICDGSTVVWLMNGTSLIGGGGLLGAGSGWSPVP